MTRQRLAELLNEDLAGEYQAIIAYVVYSQVLKGAAYMKIASELELHAAQELQQRRLIIAKQIDYLGGTPTVEPKPVKMSDDARELLQFDLDNEIQTIRNYRERVTQCESLGEFAIAEIVRKLLVEEQDHEIDLATASASIRLIRLYRPLSQPSWRVAPGQPRSREVRRCDTLYAWCRGGGRLAV